jgi:protein O-GlcNAc transferase
VLKKGGTWREAYGVDEKKVAGMVREDKIDILVELTGHTANNRLGVMACRPAPVQVLVIFNFIILMSIYVQVKKISGF